MKTYPYIVINKNNMKDLKHFKTSEQVALHIYPKTNSSISDYFIIIKDENRVINLSEIKHYTADASLVYNRLETIIDDA